MAVTYFEDHWQGSVYAIEVDESDLRCGRLVLLPDGKVVKVTVRDGCFPEVEENIQEEGDTLIARVVIAEDGFERKYEGDWEPLIEPINASAGVNTLLCVHLPMEEYKRLKAGGFDQLKERLSTRACSLLRIEENTWNGDGPALELLRIGRCP